MCVSAAPAAFCGTTLYGGRLTHPEHGLVHVLGYQNTAANLADGPNAMLLHLPAARPVDREDFLPAGRHDDLLTRMVDALTPPLPPPDDAAVIWMCGDEPPPVRVFDHDIYTVVLARDPLLIPAALGQVPYHKRPAFINAELLTFYAEFYADHTIALCCFDNTRAKRAKPLLIRYTPHDPDVLTLPALDAHTGGAPDPAATVQTDHWLVFGTDEAPDGWGAPVTYPARVRRDLRAHLPAAVIGRHEQRPLANGDFALTHADLLAADLDAVRRVPPGV